MLFHKVRTCFLGYVPIYSSSMSAFMDGYQADDENLLDDVHLETDEKADSPQELQPQFANSRNSRGRSAADEVCAVLHTTPTHPRMACSTQSYRPTPCVHRKQEDEGEDGCTKWNLRKCAALSLDVLAGKFGDTIFVHILPFLHANLQSQVSSFKKTKKKTKKKTLFGLCVMSFDALVCDLPRSCDIARALLWQDWKVRESAVLALGAIATGSYSCLERELPALLGYLQRHAVNPDMARYPLLRSISCWTISRYSKWVCDVNDGERTFTEVLTTFLQCISDRNKKVQEAACSAFATLEEEAGPRLEPFTLHILRALMRAMEHYQAKNMNILCDALCCLAEAVNDKLDTEECKLLLVPPLLKRWADLSDQSRRLGHVSENYGIMPVLECLTSVTRALQGSFRPYAQEVFNRSCEIISRFVYHQRDAELMEAQGHEAEFPDAEYLICALDLLSSMTDGLGSSIESLVQTSQLPVLLEVVLRDNNADVRQSGFALLGDLSKAAFGHLQPLLPNYLDLAARNLNPAFESVCSNASWAIGEIALKMPPANLQNYIATLLQYLIPIINSDNPQPNLAENPSITLGRLGRQCPAAVALRLNEYGARWCENLAKIRDLTEKAHAFDGLLKVVANNPPGVLHPHPLFAIMCKAFVWTEGQPSLELHQAIFNILHSFKAQYTQHWRELFASVDPETQQHLARLYNL
jgi:transportin-1